MPLNIDFLQVLLHMLNFVILAGGLSLLLYKPIVTALRRAKLAPPSHSQGQPGKKGSAGSLLFSAALLATFVTLALVLMGVI